MHGCTENTWYTSEMIWGCSLFPVQKNVQSLSAYIPNDLKYIISSSFPHHRAPMHGSELLIVLEWLKNMWSHKNKCKSQMTWNISTPPPLSPPSLPLFLTGSVWWWCQCLDSAAAYLHQSSQLDREEKDFPVQLCQWVSEIYPHKTPLDWKEAWGKLGSI